MRAALLASLLPTVFATWNPEICGGNGGCVTWGNTQSNHPWRCPDGSSLTMPLYIGNVRDAGYAGTPVATKEEFPKKCWGEKYPAANDKLLKSTSSKGQTMYLWLNTNCKDGKPADPGNCYNANPNPSTINFCAMYDPTGGQCVPYPQAGMCERWGYSTVRPQCAYWKPGLEDLPDPSYQGRPSSRK